MGRTEKRQEKKAAQLTLLIALVNLITALIGLVIQLIRWLTD